MAGEPGAYRRVARTSRYAWRATVCLCGLLIAYGMWLMVTGAPSYRFMVRLFEDRHLLSEFTHEWTTLAPLLFVALQAAQVVISPIPGDATGFLGGYLFGESRGLVYSMIGLTLGSVAAFAVGRRLGGPYVRRWVSPATWDRLGFIIEAEGAVLCFIIYLIPGLPKDTICYLFGMSPMPLWVFAIASTLGRIPGTWLLSAQGAHTARGNYRWVVGITAIVVAVALPLYYYRRRIVGWLRHRSGRG
jgi:uncharacterized membrane protein YdjX (TVP38/TMEM64 family)